MTRILLILAPLHIALRLAATEPPPVPGQPQRISAVVAAVKCPACLSAGVRFQSISTTHGVMINGKPEGVMERYALKCPACGNKFRRWEVLPQLPPQPTPARSPKHR